MANEQTSYHRSPLHELHVNLGTKMVPFGGWEMPLSYQSGTLAEHLACRTDSVVFDVSHLGTVAVRGENAIKALQWAFSNDLARISPGQAQYTHLLDQDGSVLDDIIVWWLTRDSFLVMPNASNTKRVVAALTELGDTAETPTITDVSSQKAVLAVQGPQTRAKLAKVAPQATKVGRFCVAEVDFNGVNALVAGTGYSGEDGLEIVVDAHNGVHVWTALLESDITPAGLGARDTLRLEAGLPLHGYELGPGITPLQAGLGWVVAFDKATFRGKEALLMEKQQGPKRLLQGLLVDQRRPPRHGQVVYFDGQGNDLEVGYVSSGNFSPVLQRGIALAFLDTKISLGTQVKIAMRGALVAAEVVATPFVVRGAHQAMATH